MSHVTCHTHQVKQVIVPALLGVNAPARGGCAAQNKLAQSRSLVRMCISMTAMMMSDADLVEVPHASRLEDEGVTAGPRVVTGPGARLLSLLGPSSYNNQREQENPGTNIIY